MGDKIVNSTPDLAYCSSARKLAVGDNLEGRKILLFVFKVFISELTVVYLYCFFFSIIFIKVFY